MQRTPMGTWNVFSGELLEKENMKMIPKGIFFVLEGGEGAGKSTQAKQLEAYLKEKKFTVVKTYEPFDPNIREKTTALRDEKGRPLTPEEELDLFIEDRKLHVKDIIYPALMRKEIVVCDRFKDSSTAYQGYGRGLDLDFIRSKNEEACHVSSGFDNADIIVMPDMVMIYDIDPVIGLERVRKGRGKLVSFEKENIDFHNRVREGFTQEAKWQRNHHSSTSYRIIDASGSEEEVWEQTKKCVDAFFLRKFDIMLEA